MSKNRASSVKAFQAESAEKSQGMKNAALPQSNAGDATGATTVQLPVRTRVLEAACELFAAGGFHGTHLREISKRAGTNIAGVCYHFHSKEGLYEAVIMEAGRQLAVDDGAFAASRHLPFDQRLQKLIESFLQKLAAKRAWIAKLLSRELVDSVGGINSFAACGVERDFIQLQAVMKHSITPEGGSEGARLQALSVICECVFYCLKIENGRHGFLSVAALPSREGLARSITLRSMGALRAKEVKPEELPKPF